MSAAARADVWGVTEVPWRVLRLLTTSAFRTAGGRRRSDLSGSPVAD
jgi:hypothetical protein